MAHPGGRPTKYRRDFAERTHNLCLLGLTDDELAFHFNVSRQHFDKWKRRFPELGDAIVRGRERADGRVAAALYKRACGYDVERTRQAKDGSIVTFTEHIPADFNAISLFLRNRQPNRWRDRIEVSHDISDRVADRLEAARLRALAQLVDGTIVDVAATPEPR
jgi:hypothetical protein